MMPDRDRARGDRIAAERRDDPHHADASWSSPISIWNTALPDRRSMFSITRGSSRRCRRRIDEAAVAARQTAELHHHAEAPSGRRRDRRAGDAETRKRSEAEDQARIEARC